MSCESGAVLFSVLGASRMQIPERHPLLWVSVRTLRIVSKAKDIRGSSSDKSSASMLRCPKSIGCPR
jgi:hypothetical protein